MSNILEKTFLSIIRECDYLLHLADDDECDHHANCIERSALNIKSIVFSSDEFQKLVERLQLL